MTAELKTALNADPAASSSEPATAAYNLVLKANFYFDRNNRDDVSKAIGLYREAINLDSRYAMAWARLARAYFRQQDMGWRPAEPALAEARAALKKALDLDPNLLIAYYIQGQIHLLADWNWAAAVSDVERLHSLSESDALYGPHLRADIEWAFAHFDDAARNYRRVLEHDPLNSGVLNNLAVTLTDAGDLPSAVSAWRELLQVSPAFAFAHSGLGGALLLSGRLPEALEAAEQESDPTARSSVLALVYWAMGRRAESEAELKKLQASADQNSFGIAEIYALRSDKDAAFQWLERAYRQRDADLVQLKTDRFLLSLRGDPRYQALLAKMKLDRDPPGLSY